MLAGHELAEVLRVQERGWVAADQDAASVADAIRLRDAIDPLLVEDALKHASVKDIAALVDVIADGDVKALDLIAEHNTGRT